MTSENEAKRRLYKRYSPPVQVQVLSQSGEKLGTLVNLSQEGFLMVGAIPLQEDTLYQLYLKFSDPFEEKSQISLGVDCLWVDGSHPTAWSGCQIIDCSPSEYDWLKRMLLSWD